MHKILLVSYFYKKSQNMPNILEYFYLKMAQLPKILRFLIFLWKSKKKITKLVKICIIY